MRPERMSVGQSQTQLFGVRLRDLCDSSHELVQMGELIQWTVFEEAFAGKYAEVMGRQAAPIRLLVGLEYLKQAYQESDDSVIGRWVENPYWQLFCGYEYFQYEFPVVPSSMSRFRKRVGKDGMAQVFKETVAAAQRLKLLSGQQMQRVVVDTTVQPKAVAFPTDMRLLVRAQQTLMRLAKEAGIKFKQSYRHVTKRYYFQHSRHMRAKQHKRAARIEQRMRTIVGRLMRQIERRTGDIDGARAEILGRIAQLLKQNKHDTQKLYSLHAPEVACIAKGKAHQRYEFGSKVALVTTAKRSWIVGVETFFGNPYDGHTLQQSLKQAETMTGTRIIEAYVDRGYRAAKVAGVSVHVAGQRGQTSTMKRWMKRRSAIEPVIGHCKSDHHLGRNYLKGRAGDEMNALLSAAGYNFRKLLRALRAKALSFFCWLVRLRAIFTTKSARPEDLPVPFATQF